MGGRGSSSEVGTKGKPKKQGLAGGTGKGKAKTNDRIANIRRGLYTRGELTKMYNNKNTSKEEKKEIKKMLRK